MAVQAFFQAVQSSPNVFAVVPNVTTENAGVYVGDAAVCAIEHRNVWLNKNKLLVRRLT